MTPMPGWSRLRLYLRAAHAFHEDSSVFPDEDEPAPPPPPQQPSCQSKLASFVVKNFLLCGLSLAVVLALAVPSWGIAAAALKLPVVGKLSNACVVAIFVITGLTLKSDAIVQALGAWHAVLYSVVAILFVTPTAALLPQLLPPSVLPRTFQLGFLLFCCMPTTINSGVALVTTARGSTVLALLLTVASNILGIFTAPFWLSLLLSVSDVSIDPLPLLRSLLATILVPLAAGKLLRDALPSVRAWVTARKRLLGLLSNGCLLPIPWTKLSQAQPSLLRLDAPVLCVLLLVALSLHALFLALNYAVAALALRLPVEQRKAVVIMCSQKTLPMALTVLAFFPPALGEQGLIAIPCVVSHIVQIFVDAVVCARWAAATADGPSAMV